VIKAWVLALVSGLALVGCQVDQAGAGPLEFDLNRPFALGGGQDATMTGENLRVRFNAVLEDSRCPTRVECFWTGQARIAMLVQPDGREPMTVEFNTNPAPGLNSQSAKVGDYTIAVQSLDPYPDDIDQSIALEDYRATLLVRKA
jgi:hypothetical protein